MAGNKTFVTKTPVSPYVLETKTIELTHAPVAGYTNSFGSPTKFELLKEYVYSTNGLSTPAYAPTDPYNYYGLNYEKSNALVKNNKFSTPTNHLPSNPVHGYSSQASQRVHSGATRVETNKVSGPPTAPLPLATSSTKNTSETLGYLRESANHSQDLDPRRRGVLDNLSTRAAPLQLKSQYERFVTKPNNALHNLTNTKNNY